MQFRADINGLRAVAALAIVAFHLSPEHLPGGFVGVDIFYVISGYLITSIIWRDISTGRFSPLAFYTRRARRLFPALFVMMISVYIAGIFLLLPSELEEIGRSMIGSVFYISNFYFYTKASYFDTASASNPLIHTWSLSIEEQFYIILPFILLFLAKFKHRILVLGLVGFGVFSFFACLAVMQFNPTAAFYFSPLRFWELLVGALVAFWRPSLKGLGREAIGLAGLCLMMGSILFFNENLAFPAPMALLPAGGAALVILSGINKEALVTRPLALWPVQWFGKISYSLYLWHWPIIVFYKAAVNSQPTLKEQALLLALSIGLGAFSYYAVEASSMRLFAKWEPKRVGLGAIAVSLAVVAISIPLVATGGFSGRFSPAVGQIAEYLDYSPDLSQRIGSCFITSTNTATDFDATKCVTISSTQRNFLLLGDSHAAHFYPGLSTQLPGVNISQITASGCKPLYHATGEQRCIELVNMAYDRVIPDDHFDKVILSGFWTGADIPKLRDSVVHLQSSGQHIVVLGPIITYGTALPRLLAMSVAYGRADVVESAEKYDEVASIDAAMAAALADTGATYISMLDLICPARKCKTEVEDVPIQFDYGHLTDVGSKYMVDEMKSILLRQ